ncbi:hypothetical protein DV515_00015471 [Chloebia gouldiae]|uniref:Uncharacterized protein n=1 Tax=Chloebia gouldiae TaxID=44316 RepID=A0A3L8RVA9_CHLGU|nr:hypothetical protein DV515_00015471 [Chloebia gouldiae]
MAGCVGMLGMRLINPPHFKNEDWEECSEATAGRCSHAISPVLLGALHRSGPAVTQHRWASRRDCEEPPGWRERS